MREHLIRTAINRAADVYDHNPVGGHLHIILDDGNLNDSNLRSCEHWIKVNQNGAEPGQLSDEMKCLRVLWEMNIEEREAMYERRREYSRYAG